jgi:hypothetical protein
MPTYEYACKFITGLSENGTLPVYSTLGGRGEVVHVVERIFQHFVERIHHKFWKAIFTFSDGLKGVSHEILGPFFDMYG